MKEFFGHVQVGDFDVSSYLEKQSLSGLPNIGIAVSGGGYRAFLNAAGALKAFDSRTENSTASGGLGGLLQSSTYVTGLSGGGWLVASLYMNNFTSVSHSQSSSAGDLWQFQNSFEEGPFGSTSADKAKYMLALEDAFEAKIKAGFNATFTDVWYDSLLPRTQQRRPGVLIFHTQGPRTRLSDFQWL